MPQARRSDVRSRRYLLLVAGLALTASCSVRRHPAADAPGVVYPSLAAARAAADSVGAGAIIFVITRTWK